MSGIQMVMETLKFAGEAAASGTIGAATESALRGFFAKLRQFLPGQSEEIAAVENGTEASQSLIDAIKQLPQDQLQTLASYRVNVDQSTHQNAGDGSVNIGGANYGQIHIGNVNSRPET